MKSVNKKIISNKGDSSFPEVSVIVVMYNQNLDKIIKTLDSIVIQEGISFEVIVCDDGSELRYDKEIRSYFSSKEFFCYTLIFHEHNEGTVANYYSGLKQARGKYTKLISPGDYFMGKSTLCDWIQYMKDNNAEWSFSDTYNYQNEDGRDKFISNMARPLNIRPYLMRDECACRWNYVALKDVASGAAIVGKTNVQIEYCDFIKKNGIKYCEDYIYRLMMFRGCIGLYFPKPAICYEYGTGVSTSINHKLSKLIMQDGEKLLQVFLNEKNTNKLQKKMLNALIKSSKPNKLQKLFIRGKLVYWIRLIFFPRLVAIPEESG